MPRFVYKMIFFATTREFDLAMAKCNEYIAQENKAEADKYLIRAKRWHEVNKALTAARYGVVDN